GNAYVTGSTTSTNFPISPGAFQTTYGGGTSNAFVTAMMAEYVTISPFSLTFNDQLQGTPSIPQVSMLTNTGKTTLTITSISLNGTNSVDFTQTNNCGTSVPPGKSCAISVTFTPTGTGARSADITIEDSDHGSPQVILLTGFGLGATVTNLISSENPSFLNKAVTFKAKVSSPSGGTPTGYLYFLDGTTIIAVKALKGGAATFSTTKLPLGFSVVTASYQGYSIYNPSTSAPVNQHVVEALSATALTSSPNPSNYAQAVTFTATVTSKIGTPPDGELVTFLEGSAVLGTG